MIIVFVCGEKKNHLMQLKSSCRKLCGLPVWVSYSSVLVWYRLCLSCWQSYFVFVNCSEAQSKSVCQWGILVGLENIKEIESERLKMALEIGSQEQTMCLACTPASTAAVLFQKFTAECLFFVQGDMQHPSSCWETLLQIMWYKLVLTKILTVVITVWDGRRWSRWVNCWPDKVLHAEP